MAMITRRTSSEPSEPKRTTAGQRPYHHGDLRQAVLAAAVDVISEHGPSALTLRDLARRAGVSHAAPAHHFGDKRGVLTQLATDGFTLLAEALERAERDTGDFVEVGVAYVRFAEDHPSHFEVMFRPDALHADDEVLHAAALRARGALLRGTSAGGQQSNPPDSDGLLRAMAAWSYVHGFATLWRTGALPGDAREMLGDDAAAAARAVALVLRLGPERPGAGAAPKS
jgi:AcrR family transcriptional regulator